MIHTPAFDRSVPVAPIRVIILDSIRTGLHTCDTRQEVWAHRLLRSFIVLRTISAFTSALAIFWLFQVFTNNLKVATLGTLIVLCLGCYAGSGQAFAFTVCASFRRLRFSFSTICYVPALPFPIFFVFCTAVWKALVSTNRIKVFAWAGLGGVCFTVLLFSYFFLWTAAAGVVGLSSAVFRS